MSKWLYIVAGIALTACGGGSSSGGGNQSTATLAGTYTGSETVTAQVTNGPSQTGTLGITITIDGAGNVTLVDAEGTRFTGVLTGNNFTLQGATSVAIQGIACSGTATYSGTVSDNQASGNITASAACLQGSDVINVTGSGTFSATRA